jgi:hypothetical protein
MIERPELGTTASLGITTSVTYCDRQRSAAARR